MKQQYIDQQQLSVKSNGDKCLTLMSTNQESFDAVLSMAISHTSIHLLDIWPTIDPILLKPLMFVLISQQVAILELYKWKFVELLRNL